MIDWEGPLNAFHFFPPRTHASNGDIRIDPSVLEFEKEKKLLARHNVERLHNTTVLCRLSYEQ